MKALILLTFISIATCFFGQGNIAKKTADNNKTQLVRYSVLIADTTHTHMGRVLDYETIHEYKMYDYSVQSLDRTSFYQLLNIISKKYLNDKKALCYKNNKKVSAAELKKSITKCDSVTQTAYTAEGDEIINKILYCDSTSIIEKIMKIDFIESWVFDSNSYEFKKEVLSWIPIYFDADKNSWKELFTIYRDEKSFEAIKNIKGL